MAYFGTNGVRGRFNELTPELTLRLSQAIGAYFKTQNTKPETSILVARDCRITGETLRCAVVAGLASAGCGAIDLGIVSSPTAEFMIKKMKADGCIIISASHNPPEWNALKVVDAKGVAVSKERGAEIEKLMDRAVVRWDTVGTIKKHDDAAEEHVEAIKALVDIKKIKDKKPKLVLDCGNGTAATIAPRLFRELGCEVLLLNEKIDGRFPGRPSEPTEANVKELIAAVKSDGADAGVAWDADGDRVIFVDAKGNYVIGDRVYALCVMWKLKQKNKKTSEKKESAEIVTTVATSKAVGDVAAEYGAKTRYTAIGAPYLCEEMVKKPAALGGEEVGGVIWPELSLAKDGFLTAAKMAEAIAEKPLSRWLEDVPLYYNVKRKLEANDAEKKRIVGRVLEYAKKNGLNHVEVDGVRINMKDSWVIVRASGTESYVRLFAEAKNEEKAKRLADEYEKIAKG